MSRSDLISLERYAEARGDFRAKTLKHKPDSQLRLGVNATLYFEDRLTVLYQVQEMLRVERIVQAPGIDEELDAHDPLIADGRNSKATFMLEFPDVEQRKVELARLIGIADQTWVRIDGFEPVNAIADEELERDTDEKTSSAHCARFELSDDMAAAAKNGASNSPGIDHEHYSVRAEPLPKHLRGALVADLDSLPHVKCASRHFSSLLIGI